MASGVILLFHIIGAIGIALKPDLFLQTTVFNLILSAIMVFWFAEVNLKSGLVLISIACAAFIIEVIGVKSGMPFGTYYYGEHLGPKVLDVPLVIGLNWVMLLYCCNVVFEKQSPVTSAFSSATLMVLLDYIMEQNVEKLGFWFWKNSVIPFQNYLSWFLISLVFSVVLRKGMSIKQNSVAITLYVVQILFFVYCYFIIR